MIDEDLGIFFNDFGVEVVFGNYTASALLDMPTEIIGGRGQSNQYRMEFITAELPGLVRGSAITITGVIAGVMSTNVAFTLREDPSLIGDGVMSEAMLSKT